MNSLEGVMVVGLTGQTGSGKTTVCDVFSSNGFSVINADMIARKVVEKGKPCLEDIRDFFGSDVISIDGTLDRKKLASMVFTDKSQLEILNSITYPYITSEILRTIKRFSSEGRKLILLDAPTLFESRADDFCELIISVISRDDLRKARIMERDGITEEEAVNRMNSQLEEEFFRNNSDFIIKNNSDALNLYYVAKEVSDKIKDYYNNKYNC
ncbi:MAG: dephospho-CoA kinase [Oscillospiraceae bacterium]|jgi:dephospho-CoA kinase|nr:dephospho-CoA kinase [Oscillospiraceae bacterium]